MASQDPILSIKNITKSFGTFTAVKNLNLDVFDNEFFTLVGPSGSGKSTMLRILSGLEQPTSGSIHLRGTDITNTPANQRPTAMVFQSLALFPHMTVGENVEYSYKCKGIPKDQRKKLALDKLDVAHLSRTFYDKRVSQCSGGERQRVALARAFAHEPDILFFDESLSALDFRLKKLLEKELKTIQRETGKTFVYITHNLEEAMVMSDRIGVMYEGALIQVGTPNVIYEQPATFFVSQFMGEINQIDVRRDEKGGYFSPELESAVSLPGKADSGFPGGKLALRPESLLISRPGEPAAESDKDRSANIFPGRIEDVYLLGSRRQYQVRVGSKTLLVEEKNSAGGLEKAVGESVLCYWHDRDCMAFDTSGDAA